MPTLAVLFSGTRLSFVSRFIVDHREIGNNAHFAEVASTATAVFTTDRPWDLVESPTCPRSVGFYGSRVDGFWHLPVCRWVFDHPGAGLIATLGSFLCSALNVGPPGGYMFMPSCAVGAAMHGQGSHLPQIAMLVAAGGIVSWILHMLGAFWRPREPECQAVSDAAIAIADFIDSAAHGQSDLPRHRAATSLHDAWRALIAWQPARDRPRDRSAVGWSQRRGGGP